MKLTKFFNYNAKEVQNPDPYFRMINTDLTNIFTAFQGRIRFGSGTTGTGAVVRSENIAGEFRVFPAAVTTQQTIVHSLAEVPTGFLVTYKSNFGDIYLKTASATSATFVSSTTNTLYTLLLLK